MMMLVDAHKLGLDDGPGVLQHLKRLQPSIKAVLVTAMADMISPALLEDYGIDAAINVDADLARLTKSLFKHP